MKKLLLSAAILSVSLSIFAHTPNRHAILSDVEYSGIETSRFHYDADSRLTAVIDDFSHVTIDYDNFSMGEITIIFADMIGSQKNITTVTIDVNGMPCPVANFDTFDELTDEYPEYPE